MSYFYILRSVPRPDRIYIGSTDDLVRRLADHNRGNTRSTRYHAPWEVAYAEEFGSKTEARKREIQVKRWKNRERIENLISKRVVSSAW